MPLHYHLDHVIVRLREGQEISTKRPEQVAILDDCPMTVEDFLERGGTRRLLRQLHRYGWIAFK